VVKSSGFGGGGRFSNDPKIDSEKSRRTSTASNAWATAAADSIGGRGGGSGSTSLGGSAGLSWSRTRSSALVARSP
jgi:hypothetical protein